MNKGPKTQALQHKRGYSGDVKKFVSLLAALWLALNPFVAAAQIKVGAVAAESSSSVGASAAISAVIPGPVTNVGLPSGSLSLSVPILAPAPVPMSINVVNAVTAVGVAAVTPNITPALVVNPSRKVTPSVAVKSSVLNTSAPSQVAVPVTRSEKAVAVVRDEVANWGVARHPEDSVLMPSLSRSFTSLSPVSAAASVSEPLGDVPAPRTPAPAPGRPVLSKALLISGSALVVVSLAAAAVPAFLPAAVVVWQGAFAWSGLAAMVASRFWRSPGAAPDIPRGPPAPAGGAFSSFKAAWAAARDSAAAQASFETRVGGASSSSFRDWLLGGLRTGLYWMGPALLLMLGGAVAAKGLILAFGAKAAAASAVAGGAAQAGIGMIPMTYVLGTVLPMALAAQAAGVALYFGVEALARKLGAGKAAPWLGGVAALGLAAGVVLTLTQSPFIVAATLGLEAGVLWSAARSRSFVAPLALRGILTLFSVEAARLSIWLGVGAR